LIHSSKFFQFNQNKGLARNCYVKIKHFGYGAYKKSKIKNMKGIYREILRPDHVVKVLNRDAESIAYEDGGNIICTKRIKSFDQKFKRDESATVAELASGLQLTGVR
jgi:hypothetical protein